MPSATTASPIRLYPGMGMTTTQAPYIESTRDNGQLFIEQPYELYSEANQQAWRSLYARILPRWQKYANPKFLEGVEKLAMCPDRVPRLEEINNFLAPLTGFKARGVRGIVPAYWFFDALRERVFPTTITIRDQAKLDYLPEPDIFHDIAGHVPMHTDARFADVLVRFGEISKQLTERVCKMTDTQERMRFLESNLKAMGRFFWFSVEFGLMRTAAKKLCVYGSGILSSYAELEHSIESPMVQRYPFQLEWVINQAFAIDRFQSLLFIVDSFDHLYAQIEELHRWMLAGKLDNVAPGYPDISPEDLQSYVQHAKKS